MKLYTNILQFLIPSLVSSPATPNSSNKSSQLEFKHKYITTRLFKECPGLTKWHYRDVYRYRGVKWLIVVGHLVHIARPDCGEIPALWLGHCTLAMFWSIRLSLSDRWMLWTFKGGAPRPSMAAGFISRRSTANRWYSDLAKSSDYDHRHMQDKRITLFMCFPNWHALLCHPPTVFVV